MLFMTYTGQYWPYLKVRNFLNKICTYAQQSEFIIVSGKYLVILQKNRSTNDERCLGILMKMTFYEQMPWKGLVDVHLKTTVLGQVLYMWTRSRYENLFIFQIFIEHLHLTRQTLFREVKCQNWHRSLPTWSLHCHWQNVRCHILYNNPNCHE